MFLTRLNISPPLRLYLYPDLIVYGSTHLLPFYYGTARCMHRLDGYQRRNF